MAVVRRKRVRMPTYQYRCKDCHTDLEVVQKFTDDALTECPSCAGGSLRKVFNAVGVVFKGSGFYRTDSRAGNSNSGNGASTKSESGSESKSGESGTSESTKQPATASSSTGTSSSD
jgi:putative FmdB family regulatory protein